MKATQSAWLFLCLNVDLKAYARSLKHSVSNSFMALT